MWPLVGADEEEGRPPKLDGKIAPKPRKVSDGTFVGDQCSIDPRLAESFLKLGGASSGRVIDLPSESAIVVDGIACPRNNLFKVAFSFSGFINGRPRMIIKILDNENY